MGCVGPGVLHRLSSAERPTGLQANLEAAWTHLVVSSVLHCGALVPTLQVRLRVGTKV